MDGTFSVSSLISCRIGVLSAVVVKSSLRLKIFWRWTENMSTFNGRIPLLIRGHNNKLSATIGSKTNGSMSFFQTWVPPSSLDMLLLESTTPNLKVKNAWLKCVDLWTLNLCYNHSSNSMQTKMKMIVLLLQGFVLNSRKWNRLTSSLIKVALLLSASPNF